MLRVLHISRAVGHQEDVMIGSGAFSKIYEKSLASNKFVAKRTAFIKATNQEIELVILEAAIYILCSAYKIGPKFETSLPFAVVCYENGAEFHLEKCEPFNLHYQKTRDMMQLSEQLNSRVYWLHKLHIIHKDIKH